MYESGTETLRSSAASRQREDVSTAVYGEMGGMGNGVLCGWLCEIPYSVACVMQ